MNQSLPTPLSHEVVRASAGAGKTFQLTTRYLDLLAAHEQPQHILATTFTRKAAGEVLARVLGRLASACADDRERKQLADVLKQPNLSYNDCIAMLRSLTDGLNRLAVGTIDGLFNRAARALAIDLDLPPEPRLIDEGSPLAHQMRFDAIQAVLGEQADNDDGMNTLIEMLRRLHHDTAQHSVTDAIDQIVKDLGDVYRSYPDATLWDQLPVTGLLNAELLSGAIELLESKREDLPRTKAGTAYANFEKAYESLLSDAGLGHWGSVLSNGLVVRVTEGAETYGAHTPITGDWHDAIRPLAVHARSVRLRALADQTKATHQLLALFDRHYKATRYAQRVLLFSDLTYVLANGLPNMGDAGVEELCYRMDSKVTHLLLDEFQDTSLMQWAVLQPFAEQISAMGDGSRSLFCVGDTKQAIYGWRGGCAELFDAVEQLPGVEPTTLSRSWRSSQVVLDTVNEVFTGLINNAALSKCQRAAQSWQAGYELHEAVQQDLPGHVVLQTTARDGNESDESSDDEAAAPPDAHAHHVAGYIQRLTKQLPGRSVGVLMRSRAKARTLMHALRSFGVQAAEEGGNPISHTPAVAAVLAAIQFADHPGDTVARFHVMNSPLADVLGLNAESHAEAVACGLRQSLMDQGYAAVIARWTRLLAPSCDSASLRRLMQLVELAEEYDASGSSLRPGFFVQAVQSAKVEDASPALVRVMTIHASKGLEFDVVVLPDLDASLSGQDTRDLVVLDRDSPIDPVRGVYRRVSSKLVGLTSELEQAHKQRAHEKRTEDLCLLYVAMTRAKQALHMLVRPLKQAKSGKPTTTGLTNLSYAAILRQALCADDAEGFDGDACLYESGASDWGHGETVVPAVTAVTTRAFTPIKLVKQTGQSTRTWVKATPSQMHNQASVKAADLLNLTSNGGQAYGTVIHAMLEQVGFADAALPDTDVLRRAAQSVRTDAVDVDRAIQTVQHAIQQPNAKALLRHSGADELWRERRFMVRLDDRLITGSFDRVHLWHNNGKLARALLIDYKTDRVDDDSIEAKAEGYADQLRLYAQALSAMLGLEPTAIQKSLFFVGDDRAITID